MQHGHILKKFNLGRQPTPKGFKLNSPLIYFISIVPLSACVISVKKSTTDLVIAKLKYLTFEPALGVKG